MQAEVTEMKKIIMVTAGMAGGGTERVIAVLAEYLRQQNWNITILMTAGEEIAYHLHEEIRVIAIGKSTGGSLIKRMKRIGNLRKWFRQDKEQIILSFGTETNLFTLLAGMGLKNKIIVSERNDPNQCGYTALRDLLYGMADKLVFQTEDARSCFPKKIANKGIVIPNPLAEGMERSAARERTRDVVAVGRMEPQKNHKLLLQAYARFAQSYPEYRLVLYGKGYLEQELNALAEELQIADKVLFAGFASDIREKIQNAAMYVLSSDYEGISNSLMEAMALGVPVISTDCPIGGSKMLIQDKDNGLLTPVGDAEALAKAMCYMAEDEDRAELMGKHAEAVRQEYASETICQKWLSELVGQ